MSPAYKALLTEFEAKNTEAEKALAAGNLVEAKRLSDEADGLQSKMDKQKTEDAEAEALAHKAAARRRFISEPVNGHTHLARREGDEAKRNDKGVEFTTLEQVDRVPEWKAVFGSKSGFFWAIRAGNHPAQPDVAAREKLDAWEGMLRKAPEDWLEQKAPSGMHEGGDPDGGVLVPPEISQTIYERSIEEDNLLPLCDVLPIRGRTITFPALDDKSRANGSRYGGLQSYWQGEADQYTGSRPKFADRAMTLKKLTVLVYLTSELVEDSPMAVDRYVTNLASKEIAFKSSDALVNGSGSGIPQGMLSAPALITVAKETGQAAATLLVANIENMWMRLHPSCRKRAVWLVNNDCTAELNQMAFPVGTGGVPIYQPQGVLNQGDFPLLKGRPVRVSEFNATLGTVGDVIVADRSMIQAITTGSVRTDMSMHVRFLFDELAYRLTFRMDAQAKWDAPLTPYKGTTTTSCFVALATRS